MKDILTTIFCGVGLLLSTSCQKDFEKINTNPNRPQKPLSYALFNSSDKLILSNTRVYTTSGQMMRSWMQYTAQTTYTTESRFLYRDNSGDYLWRYPYKAAGNYKDIIELNTDPKTKNETAKYGSNANQIAAARIMMAFTFNLLVETFGDIPYYSWGGRDNPNFQALQMDKYISPKYATQKEIYMDLLKELKEATDQLDANYQYIQTLSKRILTGLEDLDFYLNSTDSKLPHVLNIGFPGISNDILLLRLDMAGISVSTGSVCTAGTVQPSHVLAAYYGEDSPRLKETIRISLSEFNTSDEVDIFITNIHKILGELHGI